MNLFKQYKKLASLNVRAEECTTREEAKKILKKAKKVNYKVGFDLWKRTK
jgi:tyrosyl-tRNA synthetase